MWKRYRIYFPSFHSFGKSEKILVLIGFMNILFFLYTLQTKNNTCFKSFSSDKHQFSLHPGLPSIDKLLSGTYNYTVHQEEKEFPLAFSLIIYTDADRAIRLLRAIYRPNNHYCIHIDRKSGKTFANTIQYAAKTLNKSRNIYLVPRLRRISVKWGFISVLDAELICARILLQPDRRWKYWINLTGQEFPLRTNWELVAALKALNGANIVQAIFKRRDLYRFPPAKYLSYNVTWYKGSVHLAVRREFVDYMLNNPLAKELTAALRRYELQSGQGIISDETFFATLNHNPDRFPIPGAFTGEHEEHVATSLARAKIWDDSGIPCGSGHWRRSICMYGLDDLSFLFNQPHLFANKFIPDVEPLAYDIMELWYAAKIHNETLRGRLAESFNVTYYRSHPYAKHHL